MKRMYVGIIMLCLVTNAIGFAQKVALTKNEKKEFEQRAERMINLFTETLTIIPSFNPGRDEGILRDKAIRNTLRLFTKEATMSLAKANGTITDPMPIAAYLNALTNYSNKQELVAIDIIDFTIDSLKPHPTQLGSYIVTFEFVQRFRKKKNFVIDPLSNSEDLKLIEYDYEDVTTKSGSAVVKKVTNQSGSRWVMYLDDVEAEDIEVIKN